MDLQDSDLILKLLGGLGASIAFGFGLWQYREGQKWQKAQVILNLMDAFKTDPLIQAACLMLDWDQRQITLPDGRRIEFSNQKLLGALRVVYMDENARIPKDVADLSESKNADLNFSDEETLIRDSFDRFFDFFDKLHAF